jgi:hypothetical protein
VENGKRLFGAGISRTKSDPQAVRPYSLRVRRDHGGGLWTFEDNEGQLYLAVKSREVSETIRALEVERQAAGRDRFRHVRVVGRSA